MMRRRHRGPRPRWTHSGSITAVERPNTDPASAALWYLPLPLLPPTRVKYLCDTGRKDHITTSTILLWLDFWWSMTSNTTSSTSQTTGDVDFYIIKVTQADMDAPNPIGYQYAPFAEPKVPASITSWENDDEEPDGLDPYLWTHHLSGAAVRAAYHDPGYINTGVDQIQVGGNSTANLAPSDRVSLSWAPNVVVRAKRRLTRDEGLVLVMSGPNIVQSEDQFLTYNLSCKFRLLARV